MTLIDGKTVSRKVLEECRADIAATSEAGGVVPVDGPGGGGAEGQTEGSNAEAFTR